MTGIKVASSARACSTATRSACRLPGEPLTPTTTRLGVCDDASLANRGVEPAAAGVIGGQAEPAQVEEAALAQRAVVRGLQGPGDGRR
jgi:hypothetical protein